MLVQRRSIRHISGHASCLSALAIEQLGNVLKTLGKIIVTGISRFHCSRLTIKLLRNVDSKLILSTHPNLSTVISGVKFGIRGAAHEYIPVRMVLLLSFEQLVELLKSCREFHASRPKRILVLLLVLSLHGAHVCIVTVPLAFEAQYRLILHVVLIIFSQDFVELLLRDLLLLTVSRLMSYQSTPVASYFHHWLLERIDLVGLDG